MAVIDDEYYLRLGISDVIERCGLGIQMVGEAADGEEGFDLIMKHRPDIVLVDIQMPILNGLELMKKLRESDIESKVIVLSGFNEFEYARTALENGAVAYLLKPIDKDQLLSELERVSSIIREERSRRRCHSTLKAEFDSIKREFLRKLLEGEILDEGLIEKKLGLIDLPVEGESLIACCVKLDSHEIIEANMDEAQMGAFMEAVSDSIERNMLEGLGFTGLLTDMGDYRWCLIIHPRKEGDGAAGDLIECWGGFISEMGACYKADFSIGISRVHEGMECASSAWREAEEAAGRKLMPGGGNISFIGDPEEGGRKRSAKEIIDYIKRNCARDISVNSASQSLYISPYYLMHLLKGETGRTFNDCLTGCRMEAAKELLKLPGSKIAGVSRAVGYRDVKYFSKIFKKATGVSPSAYAKILNCGSLNANSS
ncbi:MAG: response regulator [Clostridiales bacterium]|jgi:two-component system response regulator YesN|nr:response regulator [Clostridiales bacterium]